MRYKQHYEGDWVRPRRRGWYMRCCQCGLVHRVNFRVRDGHVEMQPFLVKSRKKRKR